MSSIRDQLAGSNTDDDESSSIAPYNTFNSLTAEDSVEQIRKRNSDSGDPVHCHSDSIEDRETYSLMSKKTWYKSIEISVLVVVIALVWIMMAMPTVFYVHHTVTVSQ